MQKQTQTPSNQHQPVLLEAVMYYLAPQAGERYIDLTAGYGGHAAAIMSCSGFESGHILIDRDLSAIGYLQDKFADNQNIKIVHSDYETALQALDFGFDMVLVDLGVSSPQLDNLDRGFSFKDEAELDMRMDQTQKNTAADFVNTLSERDLADLIYRYGEERQSRSIARNIARRRPISTTKELADAVIGVYRGKSRIHPATRTFQALRIAVNDELGQLERSLPMIESILNPGGRVAIISFHSLEDRIVKHFIRQSSLEPLHKSVVQEEYSQVSNPRARSAKLRAAIKNKKGHPDLGELKSDKNKQEVRYGH